MELFINQVGMDNQLRSSLQKWRQGSSDESRTEENKRWIWRIPESRTWNILVKWMRFHIQQNLLWKNIWNKILCDMKISCSLSDIIGKDCSKYESKYEESIISLYETVFMRTIIRNQIESIYVIQLPSILKKWIFCNSIAISCECLECNIINIMYY